MEKRLLFSLGLLSASIIAFQLVLMKLISIVQWHHFAYMVISVAMLGFGASASLLALTGRRLTKHEAWLVPALMTASGLFMMITFHLTRTSFLRFDIYLLFSGSSQFHLLLANYLVYFIPFFTAALSIGILFINHAKSINRYYFSNLTGSGIGGLIALLILSYTEPAYAPLLVGALAVTAGLISLPKKLRKYIIAVGAFALSAALWVKSGPEQLPLSEYKGLARSMQMPDARIIYSKPDIHGYIQVVESPVLRYAPAVSLSYTGSAPVKKQVYINAGFYGVIPLWHDSLDSHILDHTTMALPFTMQKREKVLMPDAGTGSAMAQSLIRGALHVDAVIENTGLTKLLKNEFAETSGRLFYDSRIHVHPLEARNFLAASRQTNYDLIALPLQESFGGSAGLNALHENYLFTLEAFDLMFNKLSNEGVIAVSTWIDYPARNPLKLLSTLVETAKRNGIADPQNHIAAVRSWGTITFVLKKQALTKAETDLIREFCHNMYFDPALLPGIREEERTHFNQLDDNSLLTYMDLIMKGDPHVYQDYGFVIAPATDNKPYFSQFLRVRYVGKLIETFGQENMPFIELGYLIVIITLIQSTVLALVFIMLPLIRIRKSHRKKTGTLLYFGALGLGYMFTEIILIQRFILYFGQAVYAIAAVISTMLIASGAGSLLSGRLPGTKRSPQVISLAVTALLLVYTFLLTPALQHTIGSHLYLKISISLLIIALPAFIMGMLFPLGIRFLSDYDAVQIPWAWGINGCLSVISSSLATLIAVEAGFQGVMLVAVGSYLLAFFAFTAYRWFFSLR
jgi:hypothetical protein